LTLRAARSGRRTGCSGVIPEHWSRRASFIEVDGLSGARAEDLAVEADGDSRGGQLPSAKLGSVTAETQAVTEYSAFWQPPVQSRGKSVPDHVERATLPRCRDRISLDGIFLTGSCFSKTTSRP
jgi:hypothetical protein